MIRALQSAVPARLQPEGDTELVEQHLTGVTVHPDKITIAHAGEGDPIEEPWSPRPSRRWREIAVPPGSRDPDPRPMKVEDRAKVLKAIATGRAWLDDLLAARVGGADAIAHRAGSSERFVRMTLSLASLSPVVVQAIIDGQRPRGIGLRQLTELPISWAEQHVALGLAGAA